MPQVTASFVLKHEKLQQSKTYTN